MQIATPRGPRVAIADHDFAKPEPLTNFLTLWKDADPDIPILKEAKAEIATPRYTVTFACYEPPEEFGARKSKTIVDEADLLRFLQLINVDADDLKTGSRVLLERGYVEFAKYGSFG